MRYSIEPIRFLFFAKNMGKSLGNKYGQKLLDSGKNCTTDAIKQLQKEQLKKQQNQLETLLVIKLLIK